MLNDSVAKWGFLKCFSLRDCGDSECYQSVFSTDAWTRFRTRRSSQSFSTLSESSSLTSYQTRVLINSTVTQWRGQVGQDSRTASRQAASSINIKCFMCIRTKYAWQFRHNRRDLLVTTASHKTQLCMDFVLKNSCVMCDAVFRSLQRNVTTRTSALNLVTC